MFDLVTHHSRLLQAFQRSRVPVDNTLCLQHTGNGKTLPFGVKSGQIGPRYGDLSSAFTKVVSRVFALLVAAIFALGLVPTGAWAEATSGRLVEQTGTITISNAPAGETYNAYQIFELASFTDDTTNLGNDQHAQDAYAYVIKDGSPWTSFVTDANDGDTTHKLFTIGSATITLNGENYHVVQATEYFKNAFSNTPADNKDETDNTEWHSTALVQKFAQDAVQYAKTHSTDATNPTGVAATGTNGTSSPANVTLNNATNTGSTAIPLGYYVVDSTMGSLCMLDTTNTNMTITDKNVVPQIDKDVQEDSLSTNSGETNDGVTGYVKTNDASIGDTVHFRTPVTVEKGAQNYVLHDNMDAGLTFAGAESVKVYLLDSDANQSTHDAKWHELTDGTTVDLSSYASNHTPKTYGGSSSTKANFFSVTAGANDYVTTGTTTVTDDFHVNFTQEFLTFLSDMIDTTNQEIKLVVTYDAVLNESAVVNDVNANANETYLTYGDASKTPKYKTNTATWEFDVRKYTEDNAPADPGYKNIDGAQFQVYLASAPTTPLKLIKLSNGAYKYDSRAAIQTNVNIPQHATGEGADVIKEVTNVNNPDDTTSSDKLTVVDTITTSNGILTVIGLDGDEYILKETVAPAGYNKLNGDITFRITDVDESATDSSNSDGKPTNSLVSYSANNVTMYATSGQVVNKSADPDALAEKNGDATNNAATGLNVRLAVKNSTGPELPSTDGIGTTIFYVVGGILVAGSAVLLITKKRMSTED